jgi:hypothetical protein
LVELKEKRVGSILGYRSSSLKEIKLAPIHPPLIPFFSGSSHSIAKIS